MADSKEKRRRLKARRAFTGKMQLGRGVKGDWKAKRYRVNERQHRER